MIEETITGLAKAPKYLFILALIIIAFFGYKYFVRNETIDQMVTEFEPVKEFFSKDLNSNPRQVVAPAKKELDQNKPVEVVTTQVAKHKNLHDKVEPQPNEKQAWEINISKDNTGITGFPEYWLHPKNPDAQRYIENTEVTPAMFQIYDNNLKPTEKCFGNVRAAGFKRINGTTYYIAWYSMDKRHAPPENIRLMKKITSEQTPVSTIRRC